MVVWGLVAAVDAFLALQCGRLVQVAFQDNLTALSNRHYFAAAVGARLAKLKKAGVDISLLMIDIDDFKQINDTYGHSAGDAVLRQFAALLKANVRKDDIAVRWGGEEFLLILPGADKADAYRFADRFRAAVERHRFADRGDLPPVTVSIGVTAAAASSLDLDALTKLADEALYRAKQTKNIVVVT